MPKKKPEQKAVKPEYVPTPREIAAMKKFLTARETESAPRLKVLQDNNATKVSIEHRDEGVGQALLMEALGTADLDFLHGLIRQLVAASQQGQVDQRTTNFMLSVVKGIVPRDQIEAMLGAQMAAVHVATMTFAQRLANVENILQQDSAERAFNKLTRTFAAQMEALKRYRTGGEQKVTVQHVSVSEGGQAIVGNVTQTQRGGASDSARTSPPALTHSQAAPMPVLDQPARKVVPLAREQPKRKNDG